MKKRIRERTFMKHGSVFIFMILIATLFLGIGYAQIAGIDLKVNGDATTEPIATIAITNVQYSSNNNADPSLSTINDYYEKLLNSTITLNNDPTSSITYQVSIKNYLSKEYLFDGVTFNSSFYDNPNITYEITNFNVGDSIQPNETKTFFITFKYTGNDTSNTTLNSYLNFNFVLADGVTVTFNSNGGTSVQPLELSVDDPLGTLPTPTKENCASQTGNTPEERGCTYVGEFLGWYLEPTFDTLVDATYQVTENITLYAKWNSIYEAYIHQSTLTFDGTSSTFIDTGINIYSTDNIDKDFDISFDILTIEQTSNTQPSILNAKNESHPTFPGFVVRLNTGNITNTFINARWNNASKAMQLANSNLPIHVEIKRRSGVVSATLTGTNASQGETVLYNQANWALNTPHPKNISLGGIYNSSGNPDRFFKGTLENVIIKIHVDN